MSRFVGDHLFTQSLEDWAHVLLRFLGGSEECVTGQKNKPGPALADYARHLRNSETAVGIRSKEAAEELQSASRRICHGLRIRRRRWRRNKHLHRQGVQSWPWGRIGNNFNHVLGERTFHYGKYIVFPKDPSR